MISKNVFPEPVEGYIVAATLTLRQAQGLTTHFFRRSSATIFFICAQERSMCLFVIAYPKLRRKEPCRNRCGMPRALMTGDGSGSPVAQAEPVDAAIPRRS